jgi:chemotaxis response regulator CheB
VAEAARQRAVAVVLSGMGSDGMRGVAEIHRHGGTVIAQDAATARHHDMPAAAISTGFVDHVVPLHGVAPLLAKLLTAPDRA